MEEQDCLGRKKINFSQVSHVSGPDLCLAFSPGGDYLYFIKATDDTGQENFPEQKSIRRHDSHTAGDAERILAIRAVS